MMQANLEKLGKTMSEEFGWTFLRPQGSMYAMFRHKESSDLNAVLAALKRGVGVAGGGKNIGCFLFRSLDCFLKSGMFFEGTPANTGFVRIHVGLQEDRVDNVVQKILSTKK